MPSPAPIFRAPMRARARDLPAGAGADYGVAHGVVGIGDALERPPATLDEALAMTADAHGRKAARMLRRFADLPDRTFVWTRTSDRAYRLGRIAGPWRYDDSPPARRVGIPHVRPTAWMPRALGDGEVPTAVAATFARGGRNLQRTHDAHAERLTAELWRVGRAA